MSLKLILRLLDFIFLIYHTHIKFWCDLKFFDLLCFRNKKNNYFEKKCPCIRKSFLIFYLVIFKHFVWAIFFTIKKLIKFFLKLKIEMKDSLLVTISSALIWIRIAARGWGYTGKGHAFNWLRFLNLWVLRSFRKTP